MKKFLTSKPFIVSAMVVLCVGVAATCLFLNRDRNAEFVPDPPQQSESVSDWKENNSSTEGTKPFETGKPKQEQEVYPKVVEEDSENTVIDFTPPQSSEAEAPEVPAGKTEIEKPQQKPEASHPVNPAPDVKPTEPKPKEPSSPAPGSTNNKGQVYDPAFGWIDLSPVEQVPSDNDGDPNNMVGSMD